MPLTFDDTLQNHKLSELHKEEEEELVRILSDKYGLPYIDLRGMAPEPDAMQFVKETDAREAGAVPFKIVGRKLHVATISPSNEKLEDFVRPLETRGSEIILYLCSHASLEHVLSRYGDLNQISKVESGMLELTEEKMTALMQTFASLD